KNPSAVALLSRFGCECVSSDGPSNAHAIATTKAAVTAPVTPAIQNGAKAAIDGFGNLSAKRGLARASPAEPEPAPESFSLTSEASRSMVGGVRRARGCSDEEAGSSGVFSSMRGDSLSAGDL